jgi:amino acid transporter
MNLEKMSLSPDSMEDQLLREIEMIVDEEEPCEPDTSDPLNNKEPILSRSIGLWSGIWIIIASSVGSGIFASPGIVFGYTQSVGAALIVWVMAGLLSITGALCYAELGSMMPVTGGEFTYLKRAYGDLAAFLFSFSNIVISRPASTGILALTFGQYFAKLFDYSSPIIVNSSAVGAIIFICFLNVVSARVAILAQDFLAIIKLLALFLISIFGILYIFTVNFHINL